MLAHIDTPEIEIKTTLMNCFTRWIPSSFFKRAIGVCAQRSWGRLAPAL
jgi:hypothetical protein